MRRILLTSTAILIGGVTTSMAGITAQDVARSFQDQGFTNIEVKTGPSQIKVEAERDGVEVETVYDAQTGDVLYHDSSRADGDDENEGLSFERSRTDFVEGDQYLDDDDHDDDDDDDRDDDDENDDDDRDHDEDGDDDHDDDHDDHDDDSDDDHEGDHDNDGDDGDHDGDDGDDGEGDDGDDGEGDDGDD